ncbi:GAF domain-containing sensor histidine kinase [Pedobacter ureilyticus]|uniref:histidine kinase n=1 Tax=Pedobacter ureilyticus TaxID=1393051 RepID=A0ABW9JA64_9SPHI|nr:GAF domain-containing sensor histidine kinase [Pedobacter helvus]
MTATTFPIPNNEQDRLYHLSALDIDYTSLNDNLKDLNRLAAKVAGTDISLINLIDAYTQWTVGSHGLDLQQMTREESVCQYTIMDDEAFEVPDLSTDERFNKNFYVADPLSLRYYFGLPLRDNGLNIGALCVLDTQLKSLSPEKVELLKIIADEIVNRIKCYHVLESMQYRLDHADQAHKKVAHDIRGPLAGIIGLSEMISEKGRSAELAEVLEFIKMIHIGSRSLLDLADEILSQSDKQKSIGENELNLESLKNKLLQLYLPQATYKQISLEVRLNDQAKHIIFSKKKLLQIIGNLISNAIKFTPVGGNITVDLDLIPGQEKNLLDITVTDSGIGIEQERIEQLLVNGTESTPGTQEEKGYGFGIPMVSHLIEKLGGKLYIESSPGKGSRFHVQLPQPAK